MSKMLIDAIRRTGSATSEIRQLIVVQGKNEHVLGTPIKKISWGLEFRHGANAKPVEQYAFQVRGKTYERFADATAAVMKIHHVEMAPNEVEGAQVYVRKAIAVLNGQDQIRVLAEVPEQAQPARVAVAA